MNSDLEKLKYGILNHGLFFGEQNVEGTYIWDLREMLLSGEYVTIAAKILWQKIKKYQPEIIYGDGYGAGPLLFRIQQIAEDDNYKLPILWLRDKRKDHNRKRLIEGPRPKANARAVYVDDLFSYGTTWSKIPEKLKEEKIKIQTVALVCILDLWRNGGKGGTRRIHAKGYPIESIFTRHHLGITRIDGTKLTVKKLLHRLLTKNLGNPRGVQDRLKCPPKIYKDKIFHCTDQGDLYCVNINDGKILWKYQPVVPYHKEIEVIQDFQIFEDKLYYASYDGTCRCIDINLGKLIWQRLVSTYQHSTPEIDSQRRCLYLNAELSVERFDKTINKTKQLNDQSDISCYNIDTGDLIWRSEPVTGTGPGSVTLINKDKIIVGSNNKSLRCYSANNGSLLWAVPFPGHIKGKSVAYNEKIYAVDELGWFKIIDFNGNIIKTQRVGAVARHQFLTWVTDLNYLILTSGNIIHAYDEFGNRMWVSRTRGNLQTGGSLYENYYLTVSKDTGYIQVTDVRDGSKVSNFWLLAGTVLAPPSWDGKYLAIHTQNRGLYVFETDLIKEKNKVHQTITLSKELDENEIHY